jgi:hypothetical protein
MIQITTMGEKHAQLTPQQKLQPSLGSVDLVESTLTGFQDIRQSHQQVLKGKGFSAAAQSRNAKQMHSDSDKPVRAIF